jgi:site-specific DNA-adenine methylase
MFNPDPRVNSEPLAVSMKPELGFEFTSPIGCAGGKARQARFLTTLMPGQIDHFFEPFGGGMSMTYFMIHMGRVESENCHVGDLHEPILNFHRVLRDEFERVTLKLIDTRLVHGNGSRTLFNQAVDVLHGSHDPFDLACAYFVFNHLSMLSSRKYEKFAYAKSIVAKGRGITYPRVLRLPYFGVLFQGVSIKKRSYDFALAEAVNTNGKSFVFLDPPYEGHAKSMYGVEFDFDKFAEDCLKSSKACNLMITINDSDANRDRFKNLNVYGRGVYYGMSKKTKPELVICNYELPHQDFQLKLLGYERVEPGQKLIIDEASNDNRTADEISSVSNVTEGIPPTLPGARPPRKLNSSALVFKTDDMPDSVGRILEKQGGFSS